MFWFLFWWSCAGKLQDTGWENCEQAPIVNYENFGQAFLTHNCQSCHASTTENRYGAPENVIFDTKENVSDWHTRIYETTIGKQLSMPPAGTLNDEDQVMLYWWLVCNIEEN